MSKYREALISTLITSYTVDGIIKGKFSTDDAAQFKEFAEKECESTSDEDIALHVCQSHLRMLNDYKDVIEDLKKVMQRNDELSAWLLKEQQGLH